MLSLRSSENGGAFLTNILFQHLVRLSFPCFFESWGLVRLWAQHPKPKFCLVNHAKEKRQLFFKIVFSLFDDDNKVEIKNDFIGLGLWLMIV